MIEFLFSNFGNSLKFHSGAGRSAADLSESIKLGESSDFWTTFKRALRELGKFSQLAHCNELKIQTLNFKVRKLCYWRFFSEELWPKKRNWEKKLADALANEGALLYRLWPGIDGLWWMRRRTDASSPVIGQVLRLECDRLSLFGHCHST